MPDYRGDQAAGLRRLFGREQTRIVAFASANHGVGKSQLIANVAAALARLGKEVLILDETTRNNVATCFGSLIRYDLYHAISGEKALTEVLLHVAPGVRVLPAALTLKKLSRLTYEQQQALVGSLTTMEHPADVILVDASLDHPEGFSPLGLAAHENVFVTLPASQSLKDSYALVKKVSLGYARKEFRILVSMARNLDEAVAAHANIAKVADSRRIAKLEFAGFVPIDERVRQASRVRQPVIGLYPEAAASKAYRKIATEILAWPGPGAEGGGLEQFVKQLLHLSQPIDPIAICA